ncbi:MAG TPA: tetratricopeptide repeat protein [Roseiflexaceae bacterium]|nr:tetratricopeptide repeat protein [Roseiflexaceae bacterium]
MLEESQREEALIHFQRGLNLERAHRVGEAVEEYRRAIARYPHLREAHDALGFYYQRHGLLAKAAEEFRVVASLENDFLSHFNLGYVLLDLGRHDEALAAFERCLAIEPGDPASHYEISLIHYLKGNYLAALAELKLPLEQYPEDWEVHHLLGNCQLRLGAYDEALAAFGAALRLAPRPSAQAQVIEHICTIERYRELGVPRWAKDRLYAEHGVVYLGSAQDNGLRLDEFQDYHFTYPDIGTTLQRFVAVVDGLGWQCTCVVALDRQAAPMADALSHLLGVPQRHAGELLPDDLPLLTLAVGREAELLKLAVERTPGAALTFCLGLNWLRHSKALPDITGIVARGVCSVPWESELRRLRSDGARPEQITECQRRAAAQIVAATIDTPHDPNLALQVAYYDRHHNLRFADLFDASPVLDGI